MRRWLLASVALWLLSSAVMAAEGLWTPEQRPDIAERLPLHSVVKISGCSGVVVSATGLVITNYHCLIDSLQYHSSATENLLLAGFTAQTREQELPLAPGLIASITVEQQPVTSRMLASVNSRVIGRERFNALATTRAFIINECEQANSGNHCDVVEFNDGYQYQLVRERRFRDVRLVYAPPRAIGLFGGDEANWQWPRYAGDFALVRLYVDEQGFANDYAESNRPYQPEQYAAISHAGVTEGRVQLAAGYPGVTQRLRTAAEMQLQFTEYYPMAVRYLREWQRIIDARVSRDESLQLTYEPLLVQLSNRAKNYTGMLVGYQRDNIQAQREAEQAEFLAWLNEQQDNNEYIAAWQLLETLVQQRLSDLPRDIWLSYFNELQLPATANRLYRLAQERTRAVGQRARGFQPRDMQALRHQLERSAAQFDPRVEQLLLLHLLDIYRDFPPSQRIDYIDEFFNLTEATTRREIEQQVAELYRRSSLGSNAVRQYWLERGLNELNRSADPWLQFAAQSYQARVQADVTERQFRGQLQLARSTYMTALAEYYETQQQPFMFNANRTLRVTYGQVTSLVRTEALRLQAQTTVTDLSNNASDEQLTRLPERFTNAVEQQRWGCYAEPDLASVPVNYLTNVDATGGSSGSPTFSEAGELTGIIFDSVSGAIVSDWLYDPERHRSIHVDVRYLLWNLQFVAQAEHLLDELGSPWQGYVGDCVVPHSAR